MTEQPPAPRKHSNAYEIFILTLTIVSLVVMVLMMLPLDAATHELINFYDNLICVIFLIDFTGNILTASPKREYFIGRRGWLDLLGSIPSFGVSQYAALFRLARISRLTRIARLLGGEKKKALVEDILQNRGQYALFITLLLTLLVLGTASVLVLQFESTAPNANITTGGDALWWAIVTITTVGYGDKYPVTALGRITAVFVMFAGVGIIGALASILASLLISPTDSDADAAPAAPSDTLSPALEAQLADVKRELVALRQMLEEKQSG